MVIAHFSRAKTLTYTLCTLLACTAMCAITLYHPVGTGLVQYLNSKGLFRFYSAVFSWIFCSILIVRQLVILFQLVFRRSEAVWITDGKLFYINIVRDVLYHSIRCADIVGVYRSSHGGPFSRGIVLRLRSGSEVQIPSALFGDSNENLLTRLQEECAQT